MWLRLINELIASGKSMQFVADKQLNTLTSPSSQKQKIRSEREGARRKVVCWKKKGRICRPLPSS
jgi:hypothetical protein